MGDKHAAGHAQAHGSAWREPLEHQVLLSACGNMRITHVLTKYLLLFVSPAGNP
jgi:hypothetical protein